MDKLKYIKLENEDGSYSNSIPLAVDSDYIDVQGRTLTEELAFKASTSQMNTAVNNLQTEINSLASGSPKGTYATTTALVSANPDTGVYIVTADGHIYSWTKNQTGNPVDLGVYQSSGIADGSVSKYKLDNEVSNAIFEEMGSKNLYNKNTTATANLAPNLSSNIIGDGVSSTAFILPINSNSTITIEKVSSSRFTWCTTTDYPAKNVICSQSHAAGRLTKQTITSGANDNYLLVVYYLPSQDTSITKEEIESTIKVYYGEEWVESKAQAEKLQEEIDNIKTSGTSVTKLTDNMFNLLCYRPVGNLTKGYIALSCDDGGNALATYTIPKLKEYKAKYGKNIPVTFGLMTDSQVFQNNTYKALVQEMIADYGCEVAIHGSDSYTSYTSDELKEFLDTQKTQLTSLCNAEPKSIIYPNHDYNKKTSTIAGSYFGVCCTGGGNKPITYGGEDKCAGPRSNMYTLYRFSLLNSTMTNQKIKDAIDYAYENNMIFLPFWHDVSLTRDDAEGLTAAQKQAFLDYCIEYANQKGLTFINVGDIPNII